MRHKLFFVTLLVFLILITTACSDKEYSYISLEKLVPRAEESEQGERDPFRVSLAAITSTKESIAYYQELLDLLEVTLDRPIELVQRNTYAEVNELLRTGEIDMAFVCTYSYVSGHDRFGLELVAVPEKDGKTTYKSYIIARKDSSIKSFVGFKGKKFAFTDPMSTTGYLYPISLLRNLNVRPEQFFAGYSFTYSHDNSVRAVVKGIVDGAAVESMVYDYLTEINPELISRVQVIYESGKFAAPPVVVRPTLEREVKKQLKTFFYQLDKTKSGSNILQQMGLEAFRPVDDSAYNSVRSLGRAVEK